MRKRGALGYRKTNHIGSAHIRLFQGSQGRGGTMFKRGLLVMAYERLSGWALQSTQCVFVWILAAWGSTLVNVAEIWSRW